MLLELLGWVGANALHIALLLIYFSKGLGTQVGAEMTDFLVVLNSRSVRFLAYQA